MLLTVVHNPSAGSGRPSADALVAALRAAGHEVAYQGRKDPGLEEAIRRPADAIVLAGGDGTVGKLLHLLVERDLPIAILPLGTANNLAQSLGIRGSIEEIADSWRPESVRRLDIGIARGAWGERLFVDSAGAGATSQAMLEMDGTELPPGADQLGAARACIRDGLLRMPSGGLDVIADGVPLPPDILLAEATIIPLIGPRLPLAPGADPGDGMLDLVFVRAADRAPLAAWVAAETEADPPVSVKRVRSVTFRRPAGVLRVGDSFQERPGERAVLEIMDRGLRVLAD